MNAEAFEPRIVRSDHKDSDSRMRPAARPEPRSCPRGHPVQMADGAISSDTVGGCDIVHVHDSPVCSPAKICAPLLARAPMTVQRFLAHLVAIGRKVDPDDGIVRVDIRAQPRAQQRAARAHHRAGAVARAR
eukprot:CAMPEP_0180049592 /NCGR_PEP_ID=MMETSP0985-20121206/109_1 /TAXON_ID=483367 /ORGANISM="non described non described, Strain CCMP 2436" /LENGTH=131 /DNA_ID=CAMNT_0021978595 /DNA_START=319 /DNA_END=715 /DNA_ORIENTATION=+